MDQFSEKEQIVGYVSIDSGSLLLADGVWKSILPKGNDARLVIDIDEDISGRLPIIAMRKDDRRFLLIPIDELIPNEEHSEFVVVEPEEEEP